jgi:hypothetical protein
MQAVLNTFRILFFNCVRIFISAVPGFYESVIVLGGLGG